MLAAVAAAAVNLAIPPLINQNNQNNNNLNNINNNNAAIASTTSSNSTTTPARLNLNIGSAVDIWDIHELGWRRGIVVGQRQFTNIHVGTNNSWCNYEHLISY